METILLKTMYLKYSFDKVIYQIDMEIDPKHLAVLHVIEEDGGLTAAAKSLGTSQPALSRLVANMEVRLGAPIFDRSTRPWQLTSLGESLALQGGAVQAAIHKANEAIDHFRIGTDGSIRLGGTPYLCEAVLPSMITGFQRLTPSASVEQSHAYTPQLLRRLQRREIDFVVAPVDSSDVSSGLSGRRLLAARNIIACRSNHPLTKLDNLSPKVLLEYQWIAPPDDSPLAADLRDILNELDAQEFNTAFSGGALATVAEILEDSNYLALLPEYVLRKLQNRYPLSFVKLDMSTPTRSIMLISNADEVRSRLQRNFSTYIENAFDSLARSLSEPGNLSL